MLSSYRNRIQSCIFSVKPIEIRSTTVFYHILVIFQVWDACSDAHISFDPPRELGDSSTDMGFIVENPVTIAALRKQLKVLDSRVKVLHGTKLKQLTLPDLTRDMVRALVFNFQ